jgi:hypothetical protein
VDADRCPGSRSEKRSIAQVPMYGNRLGPHLEGRMLNIFDYRRGFKQFVK